MVDSTWYLPFSSLSLPWVCHHMRWVDLSELYKEKTRIIDHVSLDPNPDNVESWRAGIPVFAGSRRHLGGKSIQAGREWGDWWAQQEGGIEFEGLNISNIIEFNTRERILDTIPFHFTHFNCRKHFLLLRVEPLYPYQSSPWRTVCSKSSAVPQQSGRDWGDQHTAQQLLRKIKAIYQNQQQQSWIKSMKSP